MTDDAPTKMPPNYPEDRGGTRHDGFPAVSQSSQVFEQSIWIAADRATVEQCLTDLALMHRWLNPWLRCEPVGVWSTELGSESRFMIQIPLWKPTLSNRVVEREPGLIVWQFEGFFRGCDRWVCQPERRGTRLLNRFEFVIPNAIVAVGFQLLASRLTQADMRAQLQRLRQVAESLEPCKGGNGH
ncbi:SRPBCC family protein [Trichothermofontia sp.]